MPTDHESLLEAKVVVLGSQGVGKTSLVHRFVKQNFPTTAPSTIGASFLTKKLNVDGTRVKLQIWDTAGQERFRSMAPMYYRGANAAILVYDITSEQSFLDVSSWVEELKKNMPEGLLIHIVGSKLDLAETDRKVHGALAAEYARTCLPSSESISGEKQPRTVRGAPKKKKSGDDRSSPTIVAAPVTTTMSRGNQRRSIVGTDITSPTMPHTPYLPETVMRRRASMQPHLRTGINSTNSSGGLVASNGGGGFPFIASPLSASLMPSNTAADVGYPNANGSRLGTVAHVRANTAPCRAGLHGRSQSISIVPHSSAFQLQKQQLQHQTQQNHSSNEDSQYHQFAVPEFRDQGTGFFSGGSVSPSPASRYTGHRPAIDARLPTAASRQHQHRRTASLTTTPISTSNLATPAITTATQMTPGRLTRSSTSSGIPRERHRSSISSGSSSASSITLTASSEISSFYPTSSSSSSPSPKPTVVTSALVASPSSARFQFPILPESCPRRSSDAARTLYNDKSSARHTQYTPSSPSAATATSSSPSSPTVSWSEISSKDDQGIHDMFADLARRLVDRKVEILKRRTQGDVLILRNGSLTSRRDGEEEEKEDAEVGTFSRWIKGSKKTPVKCCGI